MKNLLLAATAALVSFAAAAQTPAPTVAGQTPADGRAYGQAVSTAAQSKNDYKARKPYKLTPAQKEALKDQKEARKDLTEAQKAAYKTQKEAAKDQREYQKDVLHDQRDAAKDLHKADHNRGARGAHGHDMGHGHGMGHGGGHKVK